MLILIRHAERQTSGDDPALTAAGKRRAQLLVSMLADAGVTAIFTSRFRRTKETAAPLAAKLGIAPALLDDNTARAKAQILAGGACVVVVGHSNTVPDLIAALGGPRDLTIRDDEFDRMFVLSVTPAGAAMLAMHYVSR